MVVVAAAFSACGVSSKPEEVESASGRLTGAPEDNPIYLDQGWDNATRATFYQTGQGSRMVPYAWFIHLEQAANDQRFALAANLRRMGFIVDAPSATNPDGLPVGFARDVDPVRGDAIGLTCAACHTGQLRFRNFAVRVDGSQSLIDLEKFQDGLLASLQATLADPSKFTRFADKIIGAGADEASRAVLRAQLEERRDWWQARVTRSRGASPHGPSRTDALGIIGNEVTCNMLGVAENCIQPNAPAQYPFVWDTPDFEWVQYNASVHSPIGRNVGEVTGVYAEAKLGPDGKVISTANLPNLRALENILKTLRSPKWPSEIFGAIDEARAARGEQLFISNCASCHTEDPQPRTAPNAYGATFAKVNFSTPLSALGTDPGVAMGFATRRANPGPWTPIAQAQGVLGPDGKAPVPYLLGLSGSMIIGRFFALNGISGLAALDYLDFRESRSPSTAQLLTYKARPLNGVAFTAPYLHNGSVPSMYDLLLPPSSRPVTFYVGNALFDPSVLGFLSAPFANGELFDTRLVGNSNAGHVYGTDLSDEDRMALIEYIKTL